MRSIAIAALLALALGGCAEETRALDAVDAHFILIRLHPDPATRVGEFLLAGSEEAVIIRRGLDTVGCDRDTLAIIHVAREAGEELGRVALLVATAADGTDLCRDGGPVVIQPASFDATGEALVNGPLLIEGQTLDGRLPIGRLDAAGALSVFPLWWEVSGRVIGIEEPGTATVEDAQAHAVWQVRQMATTRIADLEGGDPSDDRTMLEVALAFGMQPDVDTDRDGRERFELDRATMRLARCVDGVADPPVVVEGRECAEDPRFADGFDITLLFRVERAIPQ